VNNVRIPGQSRYVKNGRLKSAYNFLEVSSEPNERIGIGDEAEEGNPQNAAGRLGQAARSAVIVGGTGVQGSTVIGGSLSNR
jgi:hypothetical protein